MVPASYKLAKPIAEFHGYITALVRRGYLDRLCRVDSEPGNQQAVRQKAADALDQEGSTPPPAGANAGLERERPAPFECWYPAINLAAQSPRFAMVSWAGWDQADWWNWLEYSLYSF
jgi:hypothetical protein